MKAILYGPPCSGKSTIARHLTTEIEGLAYVSVGEILRKEISTGTPLGQQVSEAQKSGPFPARLIFSIMQSHLAAVSNNFIIDGYPKHSGEVAEVQEIFRNLSIGLTGMIHLLLGEEEAITRGLGRLICSECSEIYNTNVKQPQTEGKCDKCQSKLVKRPEDTPEGIQRRYKDYLRYTMPAMGQMMELNKGYNIEVESRGLTAITRRIIIAEINSKKA